MTGPGQPFDAFISYSHRSDLELAGDLQHDIETLIRSWYRSRGLRIFRDSSSLAANPDLWSNIENALLRSSFLILLASPESAASTWVPREVELFVAARGRARTCIVLTRGGLPWLPDPDPPKLGDPACSIAPAVFERLCSADTTPLIVDLRPFRAMPAATRRKSTAYMQSVAAIVAAIKQTDKDAVYGEHLRRGRRLLQIVTSTAVVFAILAGFAVRQTITERASRQRAEDAGERARTAQRETAEGVLDLRGRAAAALLARPETAYEALAEGVLATAPDLAAGRRPRAVRLAGLGQAASLLSDLRLLRVELPWTHGMEHEQVFINRDGTEAVGIADEDLPVLRWRLRDGVERSVEIARRCGPAKPQWSAQLSPDGRWVAYICGSTQIELADTETASVRWNRDLDEGIAARFHYSSDGGVLNFSTWSDESFRHRRLRVSDGSELQRTARIPGWVLAIPPGQRATALPRPELITNEIALSIAGTNGMPTDAEFSPDGRWFAAVINDAFVVKGPDVERQLLPGPNQFSFSIDSKYLAAAMKDGSIQVYDLNGIGSRTLDARPTAILRSPTTAMRAASISRDATYVVGLGRDRSVWTWFQDDHSLITRTPRVPLATTFVLAHDAGWTKAILASTMRDGKRTLALHDLTTGMQLRGLTLPDEAVVKRASCDASCERIAVASEQGLSLWSSSGSRVPITVPGQMLLELSSDGTRVLAHSGTESLTLLDGTTGAMVNRLPYHPFPTDDPGLIEEPHFISKDRFIDVLGETALYDGRTGAVAQRLPDNRGLFSPIRASPDGRRAIIALRGEEPLLQGQELLWDLEHRRPIVQGKFAVEAISWAGHRMLVRDTFWRLLDTETGRQIRVWQVPAGPFILGPDGRRALQRTGRSPQIIDLETGTPTATLVGHDDDVKGAEFSPDGATVITTDGRFIRYWDGETGVALAVFSRGFEAATSPGPGAVHLEPNLRFSADGKRCVFTGNGAISYDLDPTHWLASACANLRTRPSLWLRVEAACGSAVR